MRKEEKRSGMRMKKLASMILSIILLLSIIAIPQDVSAASAQQVRSWESALQKAIQKKQWNLAATYSKNLAVHYDEAGIYDKAVQYYRKNAEYWAKAGHADWGIQNQIRADHIDTEIQIYLEKPVPPNQKLSKFEPTSGAYIGLFLAGKRENANPDLVKDIYGKNHAIYLTYTKWGQKYKDTDTYFPMTFALNAKKNGSAIQIGFEPHGGLDQVQDGEYIRQFAREAKESGVPVFLRFASEMNGEWVPWYDDPAKYRKAFQLVSRIMKEEAPNVAMVWSPNFLPRHNIDPYYPGDEYVDWVGTSLYTIPFSHGKEVPGGNPIDYLKPIYEKYGHKPFMISEGAVSHYSYELDRDFSEWASGQIGNMYAYLPKMFPNVKAVTYFNLDKRTTNYDNQNNNYDLADSKIVDEKYQRLIKDSFFIDTLTVDSKNDAVHHTYAPITNMKEVTNKHKAFVYVKLPLGKQPYYVAVYQGKTKIGESYAQPWEMTLDFSKVDPKQPLTVIAFDKNFKRLATKEMKANFKKVDKLSRFTDVSGSHWAVNAIEKAYEIGLVEGYPGGSFRPNGEVTVAEFMTMLARFYHNEPNGESFYDGVTKLMTAFNLPFSEKIKTPITRGEVAELITSTFGLHLSSEDAVKYLLVEGLAKGKALNEISIETYASHDTLTRAEAVQFMLNLEKNKGEEMKARPTERTDPTDIQEKYQEKFGR